MIFRFERFEADDTAFRLTADGVPVPLEPKVLRLLLYLLQNDGRLVRKQEILDAVWADAAVTESALTRSIGLLRKALDDDSREPRFIETVPTAGYRFIAQVEMVPAEGPREATAATVAPTVPVDGSRPRRLRLVAIVVCCAVIAGASWWIAAAMRRPAAIRSLAVLPLVNLSGDPAQDYFADGMTDELITELAHIPGLLVVSRTSVMLDKGVKKPLPEIARELGVDAIVEGSTVRSGDRIRITAQLIDGRTDRHLWAQSFEGSPTDIVALQDSVAEQIAAQARLALLLPQRRRVDPAAQDAYLRGRYFFDKQDFVHSAAAFQKAIDLDSSYASAWAGLSSALEAQSVFGLVRADEAIARATVAARRAIELDPQNGEAYTALGSIETVYEWDWREARQNLTRGIALNSNDAMAEFKYSTYLDAVGQADEAVAHMRRAVSLDPLSFIMTRRLGATLYLARHYDEALTVLRRASEMEPAQTGSYDNYIAVIYEMKGDLNQAVEHDLSSLSKEVPGVDIGRLRSAYEQGGWTGYWRARVAAMTPFEAGHPCLAYQIGNAYLRLGDRERAVEALDKAIDHHCFEVAQLEVQPTLDPLRSDPRYAVLLRRLNLPSGRS